MVNVEISVYKDGNNRLDKVIKKYKFLGFTFLVITRDVTRDEIKYAPKQGQM